MNGKAIGKETIQLIHSLHQAGVKSYVTIMRHSARFYGTAENEAEMGLTEEGKKAAFAFGKALPVTPTLCFFSSPVSRCVETSSLIEQGFLENGGTTATNKELDALNVFYLRNFPKLFTIYNEMHKNGTRGKFFRNWYEGHYSPNLVDDPVQTTRRMMKALVALLQGSATGNICISHDWNLFLIKEFYLGIRPEDHDYIQYLEGVVIYEQNGRYYITNHQTKAKQISILLDGGQF